MSNGSSDALKWEDPDAAECGRLVREMTEDATWQFRTFTFALTATGILLSVLGPILGGSTSHIPELSPAAQAALPQYLLPFFFLTPLVFLIPSSYIIMNRARTRNRKAAYMICVLDYKRLRIAGVGDGHSLDQVRRWQDVPWETALHLVHDDRRNPHVAPALRYMAWTYFLTESICFLLAGAMLTASVLWTRAVYLFAVLVTAEVYFVVHRLAILFSLRRDRSIQGHARSWLKVRFGESREKWPVFFREWIQKCEEAWAKQWLKVTAG